MSINRIGNERWDFADADGVETRLPPVDAEGPAVRFPARWRVFGPLKTRVKIIPPQSVRDTGAAEVIAKLRALPERLGVDGESLVGRDVTLDGDTLDLAQFCRAFSTVNFDAFGDAAARNGHQAYAFAEIEVERETELPLGAGADYWMQWWIDGERVYDTLSGGNRVHPPTRADHCIRRRLSAGRHLLAVRVISGQGGWLLRSGVLGPREEVLSSISVSDRWQFLPDLDEIRPPHRRGLRGTSPLDWGHTIAIAADRCLADETIECEFQMAPEANFGIVFGAQDNGHYYTLQIPRWGQLWRARTFWACLSIADGSGYLRNLKMMLIPHVSPQWNAWIGIKVERRGDQIQTWIDGVRGPGVIDDTYGPGRAGIAGFAKYIVRHLKIDGRAVVDGSAWKSGDFRGQPWFWPAPGDEPTSLQSPGELLRLSDREMLMVFDNGQPDPDDAVDAQVTLMRSRDNGATWAPHGPPLRRRQLPFCAPWALRWFVPRPGVIRAFAFSPALTGGAHGSTLPGGALLAWRDSADMGLTWSPPQPCQLTGDWNRDIFREEAWNHLYGGARLSDGTLLTVILHGPRDWDKIIPNRGQGTWGAAFAQPYLSRSQDDGQTWSEPVPMDDAAINQGGKPDAPHGGFSETVMAELPGGRIVAHARPFAAPFMWRTHSDDRGKSWRVVTYEPFSGAGGPQLLCTKSGYLVSVKRGPALCMHISADGGVNWDEGTIIDYPASFNGQILEVEPDIVLVVYPESMGEFRPSHVRAQLIHITPSGPIPISRS